jgi:hypothetical protein
MRCFRALGVAVLAAASLLGGPFCDGARRGESKEEKMANQDPLLDWRNAKLDLLSASLGMSPVPTDPKLAIDQALWSSMSWCQWVFVTAADPWQPANRATRKFHVADADTPDLLEHRLEVDSVPVRILEGSSFFLVTVPAQAFRESDPLAKAAHAAQMLLRLKDPIAFRPVAGDTRHRSFSSNEALPLARVREWPQRIDGVVVQGDIALLVMKITLDRMMDIATNGRAWFKELRKAPRK